MKLFSIVLSLSIYIAVIGVLDITAISVPNRDISHHQGQHSDLSVETFIKTNQTSNNHFKHQTKTDSKRASITSQLHFLDLDRDTQSLIFKEVLAKDPSALNHLERASKLTRKALHQANFSQFSVLGSSQSYIKSKSLCHALKSKPDRYNHIRNLFVTYSVWKECGFSAKNLVNLSVLYIQFDQDDEHSAIDQQQQRSSSQHAFGHRSSSNSLVPHLQKRTLPRGISAILSSQRLIYQWKQLCQQFPRLETLEVVDLNREGILHRLLSDPFFNQQDRLVLIKEKLESGYFDVNLQNEHGLTPMHYCLIPDLFRMQPSRFFNTMECVKLMITHKADPNKLSAENDYSPIHLAAGISDSRVLNHLLKHGGKIDIHKETEIAHRYLQQRQWMSSSSSFQSKYTPLFIAFLFCKDFPSSPFMLYKTASQMVPHNPFILGDPHFDYQYWQALDNFHENQHHPFKYLIKNGADTSIELGSLGTVFNHAIVWEKQHIYDYMMKELSPEKLPIEGTNIHGFTPLSLSIRQNENGNLIHPELSQKLIELGANVLSNHLLSKSPLSKAMEINAESLVRIMLRNNPDLNIHQTDENGDNVIQATFQRFPMEARIPRSIIDLILKKNLNLKKRNKKGMSTLDVLLSHIMVDLTERNEESKKNAISLLKLLTTHLYNLKPITQSSSFSSDSYPFFDESIPLDHVEAHFWLLAVYSTKDESLIKKAVPLVPESIQSDVTYPYVKDRGTNDKGLVFSRQFVQQAFDPKKNPYLTFSEENIDFERNDPQLKQLVDILSIHSPSIRALSYPNSQKSMISDLFYYFTNTFWV